MITLTTLSSLNDAFVLRSMLEANEIPAFIPDENICQMHWGYINAIGGVRVQVSEEFEDSARVILAEFKENLKVDSAETLNSDTSSPDETRARENDPTKKLLEDRDIRKESSLGGMILVVLALLVVGVFGVLAMRWQERKSALIEAIGAYDTGDYDLAIADYTRAIKLGAGTKDTYYNRMKRGRVHLTNVIDGSSVPQRRSSRKGLRGLAAEGGVSARRATATLEPAELILRRAQDDGGKEEWGRPEAAPPGGIS